MTVSGGHATQSVSPEPECSEFPVQLFICVELLTENTAPAVRAGMGSVWAENISVTKLNWPQFSWQKKEQ